ncbi:Uu.00g123330.m01.CDS01 [Anthostomella pinea]|uniref:Uu.00g123330.m01.CDS01 n=1 Tax=Anthostomella pinea TaxID=933095 RepID=A0AAI8VHA0_9PEZI|nr:Uu.00g123330.m01.CDS01 [Anthostomella pinea]
MHPTQLTSILAMLASLSTAHVILESPKPYKFVAYGPSNPLSPDGSDFPCKIPPGQTYQINGSRTIMAIGEAQTLSFTGQAVHGGGSCQLALASGLPTQNSSWAVIHSIEGGCPARNQKGNLDGPNVDKYTFQIPERVAVGEYTFAWTWQARIGGVPEFYMNCAPITVVKRKQKKRMEMVERRASLATSLSISQRAVEFPELFMADMGDVSGGCTTEEALKQQIAIGYPNPGVSVDRPEGDNLFPQPCDGNPRAKAPAGPGSGSGANKSARPDGTASTPGADVLPTTSSVLVKTGVSSTTATTTATATPTVSEMSTFTTSVGATSVPSEAFPSPTSSEAVAVPTSSTGIGACVEGQLTCLEDGTHFATCTGGQLTGPLMVAPGFKCSPGSGASLDISPVDESD